PPLPIISCTHPPATEIYTLCLHDALPILAPTMPEVMSKIRKELGPDAVILNSKEIKRGGLFGFFEKRNIEVVAALDPEPIIPKRSEEHTSELQSRFDLVCRLLLANEMEAE